MPYTVARFALAGPVLPKLTDTLIVGETMRKALMAQTQRVEGAQTALVLFSGRSADGSRLQDDHRHAFFLAADDNNDGLLDHITVHIPAGIDAPTQRVLRRLRRLWEAGEQDLFTVMIGMGNPGDFGGLFVSRGLTPQLAESRVWISRTPFLLLRHPKRYRSGEPKMGENGRQVDGPEDQLRKQLVQRGFPELVRADLLPHVRVRDKNLYWQDFRCHRSSGGGQSATSDPYGFCLTFDRPVRGPLAFGYGCHFGLGQFIADGVIS